MTDPSSHRGAVPPAQRSPDDADTAAKAADAPEVAAEQPVALSAAIDSRAENRLKFRKVYFGLAIVLVAALAAFAGLVLLGGSEEQVGWSDFRPTQAGILGAQEIASYVESRYLFEQTEPLVDITARRLSLQDEPVALISVQRLDNGAEQQLILESESMIEFGLCGDPASQCSITKGEPSRERLRMLSRASLELALYTFQYVPGVEFVVAFLPPAVGQEPTWALLFRRDAFADALARPLATTLAPEVPATPEAITEPEILIIDGLTEPNRLQYEFQQLDDGRPVLVLDEP